jgi:hypothetical protein
MKNLIYIVALVLITFQIKAQQTFHTPIRQISNQDLELKLRDIRMLRSETERMRALMQFSSATAFYSEQIIHICKTTLNNDIAKLDFTKNAYFNCIDKTQYIEVCDVFTRFSKAIALYHYISEFDRNNNYSNTTSGQTGWNENENHNHNWNNNNAQNNNDICVISNQELENIKQSIKNESFAGTKLQIAKDAIKAKKCFKAIQIKELMTLFTFESDRLQLAKYSYDYCLDKDNFYTINDALEFSSSKEELSAFVNSKK